MRDLSKEWERVKAAKQLSADTSLTEREKVFVVAIEALAEIISEHHSAFEAYARNRH